MQWHEFTDKHVWKVRTEVNKLGKTLFFPKIKQKLNTGIESYPYKDYNSLLYYTTLRSFIKVFGLFPLFWAIFRCFKDQNYSQGIGKIIYHELYKSLRSNV